jgi:hypothetical protein
MDTTFKTEESEKIFSDIVDSLKDDALFVLSVYHKLSFVNGKFIKL